MAVAPEEIDRIARLARLALTAEERASMGAYLEGVFGLVEAMRAVDTTGAQPLAHPLAAVQDVALRLRDDVASEPDRRAAYQGNAPAVEDGLFLVPRVIE